jgi:two-component system osmolarity sensor histidine kinase EnvZ
MPRLDSLFARLLASQVALVLALALVVGVLFQMERNLTLATLYAERWAPSLAAAAQLAQPAPQGPVPVLRAEQPPAGARRPSPRTPRFAALRRELVALGVPVDDLMLSLDQPQAIVWLHVAPAGKPPQWLGVAGQMVAPEWPLRALVALLVSSLLLVGVSWGFTRRLTRPLERLRARMQSHTPGGPAAAPAGPVSGIAPEIVAIDAAYSDLLARLQQHERERAVLLAGVSHDLRSPLGRIRMAAELLPGGTDVDTRKAAIVRNVAEADRLIESFLDFVRSGELPFDETVDLAAAARAVVAGFDRPAQELSLAAPDTLPWPCANRLLVERLLANLVDNALKHGRPPVRLVLAAEEGQAWIDVEDAGDGIAPERVEQMQEAFARGDSSRNGSGSGLGLAIVRQVAARLGGELAFEQSEGLQRVRGTLWATRSRPPGQD